MFLGHDGQLEILLPQLLGAYAGADPVAELPDVYRFEQGRLVKANRQYAAYYTKTLLPQLRAKLDGYIRQPPSSKDAIESKRQKWIAVTQQEIDALEKAFPE
jgi:hypothetical protein